MASGPSSAAAASSSGATHGGSGPSPSFMDTWRQWWVVNSPQSAEEVDERPAMGPLLRKIWALISPDRLLLCGAVVFMVGPTAGVNTSHGCM